MHVKACSIRHGRRTSPDVGVEGDAGPGSGENSMSSAQLGCRLTLGTRGHLPGRQMVGLC